jgi:xylulokinase
MKHIDDTPRLVGIDLGTSSLKVVLLNDAVQVVGVATADYPILSSAPGQAEQNPRDWWVALRTALSEAVAQCGGRTDALLGIGLSGQMHGIVALDAQHQPLRSAILWADQRGAEEAAYIQQAIDQDTLVQTTGSHASVAFSAPKILWLRRHEPNMFARCARILQPKDYLHLRLTGEIATEATDASGTLLFDIQRRDWSDMLLDSLDLPRRLFAPVYPSLNQVGAVSEAAAAELGIPAGVPVIAGAGDTPAQAVGYGVLDNGRVLATISSGGQLFAAIDQPRVDPEGRVHTLCHITPDRWYVLGALQAAGLALRWFRDQLIQDHVPPSFEALTAAAAQVPAGARGLIFLPYLLGERTPHMDNQARAVFCGFTLQHDRAAATRAVMEGVAFAFRDALSVFRELGLHIDTVCLGGGGSRSPVWRGIFADVLGMPVQLPAAAQGAAQGAALLAGVGVGHFRDMADATSTTARVIETIAPHAEGTARYNDLYTVYASVYANLREQFKALSCFD